MNVTKAAFPYFKKYLWMYILCVLLGLGRMVILLVSPQIIALMVDRVINPLLGAASTSEASIFSVFIDHIPPTDYYRIFWVLAGLFLMFLLLFFLTFYVRWNLAHYYGFKSENAMKQDALKKIHKNGSSLLNSYSSGELITIANSDPHSVYMMYVELIPYIIDMIFYVGVAVYFLIRMDALLLIVPLGSGALYALLTVCYLKSVSGVYDEIWQKNTKLNTTVQESIFGIRTIKSYAREKLRTAQFAADNDSLNSTYMRLSSIEAKADIFYNGLGNLLFVMSIVLTIIMGVNMRLSVGDCTAYVVYSQTIAYQFIGISFVLGDIARCRTSAKRYFKLMNLPDGAEKDFGELKVGEKPCFEMKNVTVLSEGKAIVKDVTLSLPYGKKVGILGRTGSGKSVTLKALQSFMRFDEGSIKIDGRDFYEYEKDSIVRAFSYGMQEVFLFSNTLKSNIMLYYPDGDEEFMRRCAEAAEVDEFALAFADGYDTVVGEKGFGLSGGQKQRVSIARALFKNAPVLILDDCTSALDLDTEKKIFANLKNAAPDKTQIIVTHRAALVKRCDEILFFEDGEIAERGAFNELMALNGRYADVYRRQNGEIAD